MDVVSAVRTRLAQCAGQERFDLWFSAQVRLGVTDRALVVEAANQFLLDRLRKQFAAEIQQVLSEWDGIQETVYRVNSAIESAPAAAPVSPPVPSTTESSDTSPASAPNEPDATTIRLRGEPPSPRRRRRFAHLEDFVIGDGNRVAATAAASAVKRLGTITPLFLYGPTGCGKTHLLEGIWSAARSVVGLRALYLTAEQFTTFFLEALRGGGLPSFRRKCREVDLLLIDDAHFFEGKRATMNELQHTVDALLRQGRQLVLAADRPPGELTALGNDLVARFAGGLVCGIDSADYVTRLELARRRAAQLEVAVPSEVLELIATQLGGDGRQINGSLNRLEATSLALNRPLSLALAHETLA